MHKNVFDLRVSPIEKPSVGFIGVGIRGIEALKRYIHLPVRIAAVCDVQPQYVTLAREILQNRNENTLFYSEENSWREICQNPDIHLVYISTPWDLHTEMTCYAMQCGKHVALEVPMAMTLAQCQKIVRTAEQTQRHCMMLENACYDAFELTALQMIQNGMLGEIVHGEGAYIHDLRKLNFQQNQRDLLRGAWRIQYSLSHNGNSYPTHGIAPICQAMNILRGDTLVRLVSMSSQPFGMKQYAENTFGKDSPQAKMDYKMGDINSTLIQTHKGKTILLQHDVTSPRPYSRSFLLSGTQGFIQKYPQPQMSFEPDGMQPLSQEKMDAILKQNQHPFIVQTQKLCQLMPEQKPMDVIMDFRLVHCLRHGLRLDQNVYDGALWSSLSELSLQSVENANAPISIPDFTNGLWKKYKNLAFE